MIKSYVHLYTGNGKGKTTAALGLSMRAVCAGKKVFFAQFVKGQSTSEMKLHEFLPNFEMQQFGSEQFIAKTPSAKDIAMAVEGLRICEAKIMKGNYDIVVLDEINIALYYDLFSVDSVIDIINKRPSHVEIILTGRYAPDKLIAMADVVTEMKEIKHYYSQGVEARLGIEN